jgi:hypothetical protein
MAVITTAPVMSLFWINKLGFLILEFKFGGDHPLK